MSNEKYIFTRPIWTSALQTLPGHHQIYMDRHIRLQVEKKEGNQVRNKLNRGHVIIVSLQQADGKMRRWSFAAWIYKIIFQIYIPTFQQNLKALYAAF